MVGFNFKKVSKNKRDLFLEILILFFLLKKCVDHNNSNIEEIRISLKKKYIKYINNKLLK